MKFLLSYILFEKSTLIGIGVPYSVMQNIQRDFAISDNAQWKKLKYKKDVTLALHKQKNNFIISICNNKVLVTFYYNKEFYLQKYILSEKDDFGNENWIRAERIKSNITDIVKDIEKSCNSYELISGEWQHEFSNIRKIKSEEREFDEITNDFKKDFAENFTRIVKKLYGKKANIITDIIINHLKNVKKTLTNDQIRDILFANVERAKDVDKFKKKEKEKDPYQLYDQFVREHSLTIFDEYLIKFEEEYSNKYKEYLNIPMMIEKWGRDKIMTAFMIYLYTEKLIEL